MKPKRAPHVDGIPDILRTELARTASVTPEMLDRLSAANRALEADPKWQADYLKSLFVEKMLQALEQRGESKSQLADRLGKSRQYIQKLFDEDKRVNFTVDTLCEIAHALDRRVHLHICPSSEEPMIVSSMLTRCEAKSAQNWFGGTPPPTSEVWHAESSAFHLIPFETKSSIVYVSANPAQ
jgi:transcriptional regulator with XRE-family HTH domain